MPSRSTRRDAVKSVALVLSVGGLYNLGYAMGARADEANSLWVTTAVTLFIAVFIFVVELWKASAPPPPEPDPDSYGHICRRGSMPG